MRKILTLALLLSLAVMAHAACEGTAPNFSCYLDPDVSAGTHDGSQANPWQTVTWASINTLLATGNVTVFMSASNAAHNANQTSTAGINIARTDTGTNVVTFDGISKYNTNDSVPVWAANVTPNTCRHDAAGCNWASAFVYQITSSSPFGTNATVSNCMGFITLSGFRLITTGSQIMNGAYLSNFTVQYVEGSASASTVGPGFFIGPANNGPGTGGVGCVGGGPNNVTVQYSYIHNTFGEGLYIGASTADPQPSQTTEDAAHGNCMPTCITGDNYLVQYNQIETTATVGGQGDGIDVKDGHTNLRLIGNLIRPSIGGGGSDGQGIAIESGSLIDGNYIELPNHDCIAIFEGWNTSIGRSTLSVRNNICVNITSGIGHNAPIDMQTPISGVVAGSLWQALTIYNNSAYTANDTCIEIESGQKTGVATIKNNICQSTGGGVTGGSLIASSDFNDYFATGISPCPPVAETHSICTTPNYVSTVIPGTDTNFKVQAGSGAISAGTNLTGTFTNDYFGNIRPNVAAWTIGAHEFTTPTVTPAPALGMFAELK